MKVGQNLKMLMMIYFRNNIRPALAITQTVGGLAYAVWHAE
jgi:hypothetical protein